MAYGSHFGLQYQKLLNAVLNCYAVDAKQVVPLDAANAGVLISRAPVCVHATVSAQGNRKTLMLGMTNMGSDLADQSVQNPSCADDLFYLH